MIIIHKQRLSKAVVSQKFSLCGTLLTYPQAPLLTQKMPKPLENQANHFGTRSLGSFFSILFTTIMSVKFLLYFVFF
jgi:hypothetical protein